MKMFGEATLSHRLAMTAKTAAVVAVAPTPKKGKKKGTAKGKRGQKGKKNNNKRKKEEEEDDFIVASDEEGKSRTKKGSKGQPKTKNVAIRFILVISWSPPAYIVYRISIYRVGPHFIAPPIAQGGVILRF